MSFRRSFVGFAALAAMVAGCSPAPLPEAAAPDPAASNPADPRAPVAATGYRPVLAGTAAHAPVGLKPWRELNESVTPGAGRSP